jgi:hypothetical protein
MTNAVPMQPVGITFPDVTSDVVLYLKPLLDPTVRVCINLTTWKRPQPCVQIHRTGGRAAGLIDNASLQIDVRATDWDMTHDLSAEVRAHLGMLPSALNDVVRVVEQTGPRWFPDADGGARFMWSVEVSVTGTQTV